ncbi:perivitellin-2 31 kDa subunit-like isoform X1 [Littorina saxatilis]|uniref:perivitellin-2 31 kDa subunit-like isoform X1 n=1 Tax=Littorina saxatilis TaxID=31220 RepID=UPI0038B6544A
MFGLPVQVTACLSVLFLASLDTCGSCKTNARWQRLSGAFQFSTVSVGPSGVWGITSKEGYTAHRVGTYGTSGSTNGTEWNRITESDKGALRQLSVGDGAIWGITVHGNVACRGGITKDAVFGTYWLAWANKRRDIAVSAKGQLVGISEDGHFMYREGLNSQCTSKGNWVGTRSELSLSRISVGAAGIWAVDDQQNVFYRPGTLGDNGAVGNGWQHVPGFLKTISVGTSHVIGVSPNQHIWRRDGVTETNPGGTKWVQIPGTLVDVDTTDDVCSVWGVQENGSMWMGTFS